MIPLILFIALGLLILVAFEWRARKAKKTNQPESIVQPSDGECCGQHLVCERESLLQTNAQIEYYDDEELDALADIAPQNYTREQYQAIREVFDSLKEKDVPGWCRSIQLRHIELPQDIREEALLIVRERRQQK
ncbi:MAG: phospholipase [Paludibacteraceae bacterium]|nr:phospholipase [Paludibacteraceae bacterium]